jgi:hypothetical protein
MEISIAKSSSVSASNAALLVALELSKTTWVVALSAPFSDQIRHYSITGGDAVALLELIGRDAHDSGAVNREWAEFALSRRVQALRRDTGMPRPVMMFTTLQATSFFCLGRVRAWRLRPNNFLNRNSVTSAKEHFPSLTDRCHPSQPRSGAGSEYACSSQWLPLLQRPTYPPPAS